MSISNLMSPNGYNLFSRSHTVQELIADVLSSNDLSVTGELIADKIVNNTGFNYMSPWSSNKSYLIGDIVISNNQLWRCLVANSNVQPDPNNPAQAQWVAISSNNAILNNRQYAQINGINGDNQKALVSSVPFRTIPQALAYLATVGGGVAKITTTGQGNLYTGSLGIGLENSNTVLDGGDESNAYQSVPENIINGYFIVNNASNVVVKNITVTNPDFSGNIGQFSNSKNITFENVTFADPTIPGGTYIRLQTTGASTFGSHSFINCAVKPGAENVFSLIISGACDPNTILLFDNTGVPFYSVFGLDNQSFGGVTTPENLTIIVKNCYLQLSNFGHVTGMNILLQNCIIKGPLNSASTSGSLTLIGCTFLDPVTDTWGTLNLSGTAEYKLIDCFTNPNSTTDVINIGGNVNSFNYTSGPAARFNRLGNYLNGASVNLVSNTIATLPRGTLTTNTWNILSNGTVADSFRFLVGGTYNVQLKLIVQNTSTASDNNSVNVWVGESGSTESSNADLTQMTRPLVLAGLLATYPTSRVTLNFSIESVTVNTNLFVFLRNIGATTFTAQLHSLNVVQIR